MKIACVGYRSWALDIYFNLKLKTKHHFLIQKSKADYDINVITTFNPDLILFYGWSWIIPSELIEKYKCLMLHPSPLPLYRGGSPIQNQIINNEKKSKVTIFIMNNKLDSGPILAQGNLSLSGTINNIFKQISKQGLLLTLQILDQGMKPVMQNEKLATYFKRRKSNESEITLEELKEKSAVYLVNKIRMLADPYPNAFIRTSDGYKLIIKLEKITEIK